jgi:hypothetical protein
MMYGIRTVSVATLGLLLAACSSSSDARNGSTGTGAGGNTGGPDGGGAVGATGAGASAGAGATGSGATGNATGVAVTCIVGSKGCLCDSTGHCASGLTCTPQTAPNPNLCCSGADCAPATTTSIGSSCAASGGPACSPGVTVPAASGSNDNCGYLATDFNESVTLCGINAGGGGDVPAQIQVFYNDEHALTLGCTSSGHPVSALPSNPGGVYYPQVGDPSCNDTSGRPMRPVLFITDITADPNCTAGDQQKGGTAYEPVAVFGTWKAANSSGTPDSDPTPRNYWNLGSSGDAVPAGATAACPCTSTSCTTSGRSGRGYGAEVRFEAGLIAGHSYRLQVMVHDGDQTQGGDSGEYCAIFCAGGPALCGEGHPACGSGGIDPSQCAVQVPGTTCTSGCCI